MKQKEIFYNNSFGEAGINLRCNGNLKKFSDQGFWRRFIDASAVSISDFVIYSWNSNNRTQEPDKVKPNLLGLKPMPGNVMEYCADKYSVSAYSKTSNSVKDCCSWRKLYEPCLA